MQKKAIILCLMIMLVFSSISLANGDFEEHNHKLLKFLEGLKGLEYEISNYIDDFEGYPADTDKFARQFYEDFINGRVEFIKPEYRTDDINDPEFQKYLKKYPQFKFVDFEIIGNEEDFMTHNEKYAHYNFKIYQINFDNNEENGKEDVFYSSGYYNEDEDYGHSVYSILNEKNNVTIPYHESNASMGGQYVSPEYEGRDKIRTKDYHGIIKYKDRYYIYEVWDWDTMFIIKFYSWKNKKYKCLTVVKYKINLKEENDE
ncbi:hypothetical protein [Halocella sp. SP3-1]|uniref:hypothetical protein n=1 Tax=Halocella sp. SP3-1 TaxID=2382161 RepID=UPI000F75CF43|nr:hypothetical protein [Halocella sp. SP3-1]AZO94536.1 hypothetical protein D7D81_07965 [Halocella sp. SP3-1]AZO94547.1 hypothetical protein D7D81_08035 [Halocella sp. SP3-1]